MQNLIFSIGTTTGPYHCSATALPRDSRVLRMLSDLNHQRNDAITDRGKLVSNPLSFQYFSFPGL